MNFFNSDEFIGEIQFRPIRIYPISNNEKYDFTYKTKFFGEKLKIIGLLFCSLFFGILPKFSFFLIPMIASEKSHKNLSDDTLQLVFK